MDLSNRVSSKKHVDFNDARYQLSDKLRPASNYNVRQSFTLYDDKSANKVSVHDISAAYALSDKKIPVGELLNKMMDLIFDLQDGALDSQEDAVYAWKFAQILVRIFDDRIKHGESISAFDNSLKNSVINSVIFSTRYPNKYTLRTNFYDKVVLAGLLKDVTSTFKEDTIPKLHTAAITQSRETAETHHNETLDRLAQWTVAKYNCKAESFYEINEDADTGLMYATNVVILHMRNGYDVSLLGYVGTEHDNEFCFGLFNACDSTLTLSRQNIQQDDVKKLLVEAANKNPVNPITRAIRQEAAKESVIKKQIEILSEIRPMIKEDILKLRSAEEIVGKDYIWGCENYRLTHRDLPDNFQLSDVILPQFDPNSIKDEDEEVEEVKQETVKPEKPAQNVETPKVEQVQPKPTIVIPETKPEPAKVEETEEEEVEIEMSSFFAGATGEKRKEKTESLFDDLLPKKEEVVHKDINDPTKQKQGFNKSSILLPGLRFEAKKEEDPKLTSLTANAKQVEKPQNKPSILLPSLQNKQEPTPQTVDTPVKEEKEESKETQENNLPVDIADLFK